MSETATKSQTGAPQLLAEYDCDDGRRQLIGQRVEGKVRITDRLTGGRSYLVADEIASMAELEGLVQHYLEHADKLGYAPADLMSMTFYAYRETAAPTSQTARTSRTPTRG